MSPQLQADLDHIVKHAEPYLRQLDGKQIFITGATGFFGKWMTMALDRSRFLGFDISYTSLVRRPAKAGNEWRCLINELPMRKQHCPIDYVMHFAYDHESVVNNISGMQRIIDFSKNNNVRNILFTSSQAVHMDYTWNDPRRVVAETKRLCETMLAQSGQEGSIVRGYSFVGPMMDLDRFAVGNFIKQALAGEPVLVRSPNTPRGYLHACDMVIELLRSLVEVRCCELGSPDAVTLVRVARLLTDNVVLGDDKPENSIHGDCEPTIPLEDALKRTMNYYVLEGLRKT
jgi:nucleoside-diphosphate-sugar epimerase